MASCNLSYSGSTGVLEASASVTEKTTTGTSRTLRLKIYVHPIDYGGARSFGWNASCQGQNSSGNGAALDSSGIYIFDKDITVSVPYGSTSASVDCSFTATVVSPSAGNKSISGTISKITGLTLQQGTTALTGASNVYFGSACSVSWKPTATNMYYKLKFDLGQWTHTTDVISPNTTSAYTYTGYTIPYDAATQIPNAVTATMYVTLYTYSNSAGTNQVGSSSTSFTVTLPASVKPSISSKSATIDNSSNTAVNGWNVAVAGFTKLRIVAAASGAYGSTISSFKITGAYEDTITGSSLDYTGKIIQSSGNQTVTITCVDSRGRESAAVTTTAVSFASYTAPTISQFTAEKNSSGKACLKAIFSYDSVGGKNTATATLYYRQSGSSAAWTAYGTKLTSNVTLTTNLSLSDEKSYNFKVVLTDAPGNTAEKVAFLSTAKVLLDFKKDGDGLGVGKICENPGMEVSMDATFYGSVKIGELTLEQFIQSVMKVLPSTMYGTGDPPTGAVTGQIYFKKL